MLVFAPLPLNQSPASGSLAALFERRYESYKEKIVRPFYAQHFARLDRQIVLVDLLSALNGGAAALADLETALTEILLSFRVGAGGVLSDLFAPRVRKVLFAATKADHLHHSAHGKLEAILRLLVRRARHRARGAGAEVEVLALSAVRATREVTARAKGEALPSVAGVPEAGERLGGKRFDGDSEAAIFPGDLPDPPEAAFALAAESLRFLRFRPPLPSGEGDALPQIRLDAALEFLLADALA